MKFCHNVGDELTAAVAELRDSGQLDTEILKQGGLGERIASENFSFDGFCPSQNCNVAPLYRYYAFPPKELYGQFASFFGVESIDKFKMYVYTDDGCCQSGDKSSAGRMEVIRGAPTFDMIGEFDLCAAFSLLVCAPIAIPVYCCTQLLHCDQQARLIEFIKKTDTWVMESLQSMQAQSGLGSRGVPSARGMFFPGGGGSGRPVVSHQPALGPPQGGDSPLAIVDADTYDEHTALLRGGAPS